MKEWLLDLLACSDPAFPTKDSVLPYTELARTYMKMRNEAKILFHSIDSCAIFKDYARSLNFNADMLSVDDAINFASKLLLPSESDLPSDSEKIVLNNIESAKQGFFVYIRLLEMCSGMWYFQITASADFCYNIKFLVTSFYL